MKRAVLFLILLMTIMSSFVFAFENSQEFWKAFEEADSSDQLLYPKEGENPAMTCLIQKTETEWKDIDIPSNNGVCQDVTADDLRKQFVGTCNNPNSQNEGCFYRDGNGFNAASARYHNLYLKTVEIKFFKENSYTKDMYTSKTIYGEPQEISIDGCAAVNKENSAIVSSVRCLKCSLTGEVKENECACEDGYTVADNYQICVEESSSDEKNTCTLTGDNVNRDSCECAEGYEEVDNRCVTNKPVCDSSSISLSYLTNEQESVNLEFKDLNLCDDKVKIYIEKVKELFDFNDGIRSLKSAESLKAERDEILERELDRYFTEIENNYDKIGDEQIIDQLYADIELTSEGIYKSAVFLTNVLDRYYSSAYNKELCLQSNKCPQWHYLRLQLNGHDIVHKDEQYETWDPLFLEMEDLTKDIFGVDSLEYMQLLRLMSEKNAFKVDYGNVEAAIDYAFGSVTTNWDKEKREITSRIRRQDLIQNRLNDKINYLNSKNSKLNEELILTEDLIIDSKLSSLSKKDRNYLINRRNYLKMFEEVKNILKDKELNNIFTEDAVQEYYYGSSWSVPAEIEYLSLYEGLRSGIDRFDDYINKNTLRLHLLQIVNSIEKILSEPDLTMESIKDKLTTQS